jgi:hypothetical protein
MLAISAARPAKPAGQAGTEGRKAAACSQSMQLSPAAQGGSGCSFTGRTTPPARSGPSITGWNHDGRVTGSRPGEGPLLAGALIARLVRAFPAMGPAQHPAGLAVPGMRRQCTELTGKAGAGASDDDG